MDSYLLEATSIPTFWFIIYVNGLFICIFRCNNLLRQGWDRTHRAGDMSIVFHATGISINFEGISGDGRLHTEGGCSVAPSTTFPDNSRQYRLTTKEMRISIYTSIDEYGDS